MDKKKKLLRNLPVIIGVVLVVAIGVGVWLAQSLFGKPASVKKQVQQITLVQPPPPPPPPEVKPPPPPVMKEEKVEEPEPAKEPDKAPEKAEAPPAEDLGLDAEGGAGSDAFGLVGRKGGRSLLGGTPGSTIMWYGGQIKQGIESGLQTLLEGSEARKAGYSVTLNVWVGPDGQLVRAELATGSGQPAVDAALRAALPRLHLALPKPPPENMPQPVKLRLTSRL